MHQSDSRGTGSEVQKPHSGRVLRARRLPLWGVLCFSSHLRSSRFPPSATHSSLLPFLSRTPSPYSACSPLDPTTPETPEVPGQVASLLLLLFMGPQLTTNTMEYFVTLQTYQYTLNILVQQDAQSKYRGRKARRAWQTNSSHSRSRFARLEYCNLLQSHAESKRDMILLESTKSSEERSILLQSKGF